MNRTSLFVIIIILNEVVFGKVFTNIEGEGTGITTEKALLNAKRDALEKSVGMMLSSKSITKNNMTISDKILTKSEGFIKKYEIIDKSKENDQFRIRINADITNLIDELIQDEFAIKFLIEEMGFPKFGVIIYNSKDSRDSFAEDIVIENLKKYFFDVYKISNNDSMRTEASLDFLVEGKIEYSTSEIKAYDIKDMYSVHTKLSCSIRMIGTDEIISIENFTSKKAHFDSEEAKRQSISLCSDKISKFLINDSIEKWSKYYNQDLK